MRGANESLFHQFVLVEHLHLAPQLVMPDYRHAADISADFFTPIGSSAVHSSHLQTSELVR